MSRLRRFHAASWDEPLIHRLGAPGRRGQHFPLADAAGLVPDGLTRAAAPDLPELSEPEVLHHYLRLSQETMGMLGVSLFGTCTMKYNPRAGEQAARALADAGLAQTIHSATIGLRQARPAGRRSHGIGDQSSIGPKPFFQISITRVNSHTTSPVWFLPMVLMVTMPWVWRFSLSRFSSTSDSE